MITRDLNPQGLLLEAGGPSFRVAVHFLLLDP